MSPGRTGRGKRWGALARALGVAVLGLAALISLLPLPPSLIEAAYSRGLYPVIAAGLIAVTGPVPFSVIMVLLVIAPVVALIALWRSKRRLHTLARGLMLIALGYGLFQLLWGLNYRREPLETLLNILPGPPETARLEPVQLEEVARGLLAVIRQDADAPRNEGVALEALRVSLSDTVHRLTGVRPTLPARVKSPPAGWLLAFRVSGVISPLTLEAHVDAALPEPFRLAVTAHELAHLCGFAGEADADLIAAISGLASSDPYLRYAVALQYYARVFAELPTATQATLRPELPARARADYDLYRAVLKRHELPPLFTAVTEGVYDRYLQTQGVKAGIRDYSRVVTLLARWWQRRTVR